MPPFHSQLSSQGSSDIRLPSIERPLADPQFQVGLLNEQSGTDLDPRSFSPAPQPKAPRWNKDILAALESIKREEVLKAIKEKMSDPSVKARLSPLGHG